MAELENQLKGLKLLAGIGGGGLAALMTVLLNLFIGVQQKAEVSLDVARQHGQEILEIRSELNTVRSLLERKTTDRYYRQEAEREHDRLEDDIKEIRELCPPR